jgi:hypothetical protein
MTREQREKMSDMDRREPGWRTKRYENGAPMFAPDGMMLDEDGSRSIFDDVDD